MSHFALIGACLFLGVFLRKTGRLPQSTPAVLNGFVIHLALPALTLLHLHGVRLEADSYFAVGMAWLLFILGVLFFVVLGRLLGWNHKTIGCLALTAGFSNTAFMGFPLIEAIYGPHALKVGVLTDQPGSSLALCTIGVATASLLASGGFSLRAAGRRIAAFPPFYAVLAAIALDNWTYPPALAQMLEKLAATLVPVALVSVGYQTHINARTLRPYWSKLGIGLFYKLILGPALIAALYVGLFGARGEAIQITLLQSAMAPMMLGAVVASEFDLEPRLANLILGIGIPLSLLTVTIWARVLSGI